MNFNKQTLTEYHLKQYAIHSKIEPLFKSTGSWVELSPTKEIPKWHGVYSINLSSIFDKLIHNAGRFAETYCCDILVDIENIKATLNQQADNETTVFYMGVRKGGVDCIGFVCERLGNSMNQNLYEYRKLYAVIITKTTKDVTVELKQFNMCSYTLVHMIEEYPIPYTTNSKIES